MADIEISAQKKKALQTLGGIVGAGLGIYSGIHVMIPIVAASGAWWVGKKFLPPARLPFLPAIAVQTGHLFWILLGVLYLGRLDEGLIDVVVLGVGLSWLIVRPGLGPLILLTLFQAAALVANGYLFAEADFGTNQHKALLIHIVLRVVALFSMWYGHSQWRKVTHEAN
jgi:hypothetical protein